jgi:hypothetical protein
MRLVACLILLPLLLLSGCGKPAPPPLTKEQLLDRASADFFAGPIPTFEVQIATNFVDSLRQDGRKSVPATVIVGTNVFESVSVHVKGAAGSTRSIDDNPALTLSFGKFKEGQDCFGLRKLHLNNSVQDPTRLDELVASSLYRMAGVPTARTTHALVRLNGRDLGLYVLKEGYDKTFVRRNFPYGTNEPGNLYDGGFVRDIDQDLDREVGAGTNSYADLRLLRDAVNEPVATRAPKLAAILNVDRFLTFLAIQSFTDDWDGYARNHNNYRLYHDRVSGRFHFIPHGMDQLFANPGKSIEPEWNGVVVQRLFELPDYRDRYLDRLAALSTNILTESVLTNLVAGATVRLRAAMAGRDPEEQERLFRDIGHLRARLVERVRNVEQQLILRPKPVKFDAHGELQVGGWLPRPDSGNGVADVVTLPEAGRVLHLVARSGGTVAGFRAPIRLPSGHYILSGRVKTRDLDPVQDDRGRGAGLRIGGSSRSNSLAGTADWTLMRFDFDLPDGRDLELVAEIRANRGEAWFDLNSLHLTRHAP